MERFFVASRSDDHGVCIIVNNNTNLNFSAKDPTFTNMKDPSPLRFVSCVDVSQVYQDNSTNKLHKLTAHPTRPDASIWTVLDPSVRRVSVYNAPSLEQDTAFVVDTDGAATTNNNNVGSSSLLQLHASFTLQNETDVPVDMCWTTFAFAPHHALLCVLAGRSTVYIWDVYPTSTSSSTSNALPLSSWIVPLPFDCSGIHSIPYSRNDGHEDGSGGGLLLCRLAEVDEDEIIELDTVMPIPSLFTLSHPLEDVLPVIEYPSPLSYPSSSMQGDTVLSMDVSTSPTDPPIRPFLDAHEEVLWVGSLANPSSQKSGTKHDTNKTTNGDNSLVLCVTYHAVQGRHTIRVLRPAPLPPPTLPLYQQTRQRSNSNTGHTNPDVGNMDWWMVDDVGDWAPLLPTHNSSTNLLDGPPHLPLSAAAVVGGGTSTTPNVSLAAAAAAATQQHTRDEALADALGVSRRLTPRAATSSASAPHHPRNSMTGGGAVAYNAQSHQHRSSTSAVGGDSLLSPRGMDLEPSHFVFPQQTDAGWMDQHHNSQGGEIPASWAAQCLYREPDASTPSTSSSHNKATTIFTIPDTTFARSDLGDNPSSSTLLCLLIQGSLHFFKVGVNTATGMATPAIEPWSEMTLSCRSVQPMHDDWMLLLCDEASPAAKLQQPTLRLYRGPIPIVSCEVPTALPSTCATTMELQDAVHNHVTLVQDKKRFCRISLSLRPLSTLAERALTALEGCLSVHNSLKSKMRLDVCRLEQCLGTDHVLRDDTGFDAFEAVVVTMIERDLLGSSPSMLQQHSPQNQSHRAKQSTSWERLLASEFHCQYSIANELDLLQHKPSDDGVVAATRTLKSIQSLTLLHFDTDRPASVTPIMFDALHLLYEECKFSRQSTQYGLPKLARLLNKIVRLANRDEFSSRYLDYYQNDQKANVDGQGSYAAKSTGRLTRSAIRMGQITKYPEPPSIMIWLEHFMKQGNTLRNSAFDQDERLASAFPKLFSIVRIVKQLFSGVTSGENDLTVIRLLLEEGFTEPRLVRELPIGVALPILELLHRCRTDPTLAGLPGWTPEAWHLIGRDDLRKNLSPVDPAILYKGTAHDAGPDHIDPDSDGLVPLELTSSMLFPLDNRIHEAARLLRSSRPIFLRVNRPVEVTDHDYERLKQKKLSLFSARTFSLPVGRGMLTFGSLRPVAAERLPIPELCLKGRVPPTNASLALDESDSPADLKVWPEFHNGLAAGLRLPACGECTVPITRTWIIYNRPVPSPAPTQGEEEANPLHLRQGHTHAGLLLALGLRGHLDALEMSDIYEYLTQGSVTTTVGVLLGMAANKRGSCDIAVSKMLCLHIPSLIPQHFSAIDVASTVQAAAILGCGLLFQKSSHRMMTEFLLNEIGKRPESVANAYDRDSYTLSCGLALGMVNLCIGEKTGDRGAGIADIRVEERLYRYMVGGVDKEEARRRRETNDRFSLPTMSSPGDSDKCCTIYEGELINTAVTAPGATLALGLMYMKSGNRSVAAALSIPDTYFLLEFARPDFLTLRLIAKALVLWDEVEPTDEWIWSQIPQVVHKAYNEMRDIARRAMDGNVTLKSHYPEYDRRSIRQIHAHLVAGACFGMGLRFAGTADARAKSALTKRVLELHALREGKDPVSIACRPDPPILESCLSCAAIALAMVMAGTGDLDTLRLFKILRWRCEEGSRYGNHMMYGMAIGLLFLGGGTSTIGREPEDLAALVTAFFPRFPFTTSDNEYHLQALRHLYALAVKRQDIRAVDVDSNETVHLPITVLRSPGTAPLKLFAPCLLPNADDPYEELTVDSPKHYPLKISLRHRRGCVVFYVKKRNSNPHAADALGLVGPSESHILQSFERYLTRPSDSSYALRCLHDCTSEDSEEALPAYLSLLDNEAPGSFWNLRLFRTYYQVRNRAVAGQPKALLNVHLLLACMNELAEMSLHDIGPEKASRYAESFYGD